MKPRPGLNRDMEFRKVISSMLIVVVVFMGTKMGKLSAQLRVVCKHPVQRKVTFY